MTRFAIPDIPFTRTVLPNGLTLVTHEDRKAPIVAVNVWYHVGSKDERPGRTGLAHLFEHLMFNGSEHFDHDYFEAFEPIGATEQNGTTSTDRTNYFQNVPTSALDLALWMESDRMGHLLGAIDQAKLDEQRGVVQNEKRQYENQPYGRVHEFLMPRLYPPGHPYSWTVIGSMADLDAASLDDVHAWFRRYYGAANATLVLAGDLDHATAVEKAMRFFGDIPPGPPLERQRAWVARRSGSRRGVLEDRVPQARLYRTWNVPEWGSADADLLNLLTDVLGAGRSSRLYRRLVHEAQVATDVSAYIDVGEIGSSVWIEASAKDGVPLAQVEAMADEELRRLLRDGPTADEVARVQTQHVAQFLRGIERVGGFGGKSDVLAQGQVFAGRPDAYREQLARVTAATAADLHDAARRWLADGDYVLHVVPFPDYAPAATGADRSALPAVAAPPAPRFPRLEEATLPNGLRVVLAERPTIPQVRLDLVLDAGYAADRSARPGAMSFAMAMLLEGTTSRPALEVAEAQERLGARLRTRSSLDSASVSVEALLPVLEAGVELFADVALRPALAAADVARVRDLRVAEIRQEQAEPLSLAFRLVPPLLYGDAHPYAVPLTGTGTLAGVEALGAADLAAFHRTWFRPQGATLVVTGDATMPAILPLLERQFAAWPAEAVPAKPVDAAVPGGAPAIWLVDRPGSTQSAIVAAAVAPPKRDPDEPAIEVMTAILGGTFTSRLNMNLREDKHWTYGAGAQVHDARGPRPFLAYTQVQGDRTADAIAEMRREFDGILGSRPITDAELAKALASLTLTLPGSWETMGAVARSIRELVVFGLPEGYWDAYAGRIAAVGAAEALAAARRIVRPEAMTWVVVGDAAAVAPSLRALGLGPVRRLDAEGRPLD